MPRYEYRDLGFEVPRHWEEKSIIAFSAPKGQGKEIAANMVVTRDALTEGESMEAYTDRQIASLSRKLDEFALADRAARSIDNKKAALLRFTSKGASGPLEQRMLIVAGARNKLLCLTTTAALGDTAQMDPLFDRMLESVSWDDAEEKA